MQWRSTLNQYGLVAKSLHWIIVVGIIAEYLLAEGAEDESVPVRTLSAMDWHESIGITLLALAAIRMIWRVVDRRPEWPAQMRRYERALAWSVHTAFYVLLLAIPISGWLIVSIEGESLRYFTWFDLPAIVPAGSVEREHLAEEVHEFLFNVLVALAVFHVVAALKHHFIDRDNVLRRMVRGAR